MSVAAGADEAEDVDEEIDKIEIEHEGAPDGGFMMLGAADGAETAATTMNPPPRMMRREDMEK